MEKYRAYDFTRTGSSGRIADRLTAGLSRKQYRIGGDVGWAGLGAYRKFQAYAKGKGALAAACGGSPSVAAERVAGSPIRGSRLACAVRRGVAPVSRNKTHPVATSIPDALCGGEGYPTRTGATRRNTNENAQMERLPSQPTQNA